MRHLLIILFMLAGLTGHCFATEEQPADAGGSTTQPADSAPEGGADKNKPAAGGKKKPAEDEAEPDCE